MPHSNEFIIFNVFENETKKAQNLIKVQICAKRELNAC